MRLLLQLAIGVLCLALATSQKTPLRQVVSSCAGKSINIDCGVGKIVEVVRIVYGASNSNECEYNSGDCTEIGPHACLNKSKCSILLTKNRKLNSCPNKPTANYVEVDYYCISTQNEQVYDICNTAVINAESGFIQSPEYPSYKNSGPCTTKLTAPPGMTFNIWTVDMAIGKRNSDQSCFDDYVRVSDVSEIEVNCGQERPHQLDNLCSNEIYITYKATSRPIFGLKGFKLFFATRPQGSISNCPTGPVTLPPEITTSVAPVTDSKPILEASSIYRFFACLSKPTKLTAPAGFILYVEEFYHRVTQDGQCPGSPDNSHCTAPVALNCNHAKECQYSLLTSIPVDNCGKRPATYIFGVYRFIPIDSKVSFTIDNVQTINVDQNPKGILTSPNYPQYQSGVNKEITISSSSKFKVIRVYFTDLNIDESFDCANNYVQITPQADAGDAKRWCGSMDPARSYHWDTCSSTIKVKYATFTQQDQDWTGFRLYYEVLDNVPVTCTNIVVPVTTPAPSNEPVVSLIPTTGGNGGNKPCVFPFVYQSIQYLKCVTSNDYPEGAWCGTTSNYDRDQQRGTCGKGATGITELKICRRQKRKLSCPAGYIIRLIGAEGILTQDNSCDISKFKSSEDVFSKVQPLISNKETTEVFGSILVGPLSQSVAADILVIEYDCLPEESVDYIPKLDACNGQQTTAQSAIVKTPGFPNIVTNLECSLAINTQNTQKLIKIYSISTELQPLRPNQQCDESYITLNKNDRFCGSRRAELIIQKCGTSFELGFKVGSKGYKGFKIFYELTNVDNPLQCAQTVTTTPRPGETTTLPDYALQNLASPLYTLNNCKLDNTITCPAGYVISLKRVMYGVSKENTCFYKEGDCVVFKNPSDKCSGQNSCLVPPYIILLPECGLSFASYSEIQYECIPAELPRKPMCGATFTDRNGIISNPNYPIYESPLDCKATIRANPGQIIKAYILGMSLNKDCATDSLTFIEANPPASSPFCGQVKTGPAFETCDNVLDINLITKGQADNSLMGVSIYYETLPKPSDHVCVPPTTRSSSTTPTRRTTSTTTLPDYSGLASTTFNLIKCETSKITCPRDYVIMVMSSFNGVSRDNQCGYNPADCFGRSTKPELDCSGKQSCQINFIKDVDPVPECGSQKASYYFVDYICVPIKNAGNPIQPKNTEFCADKSIESYIVDTSLLIQSKGYSIYPPPNTYNCVRNITTQPGFNIAVFLTDASFPGTANCDAAKDFVSVTDGFDSYKFCGGSNRPRFLLTSRSNWLQLEFKASTALTFFSRGFQLYLEAYKNPITTAVPAQNILINPTAQKPGFATTDERGSLCLYDSSQITCPPGYMIVPHYEHLVASNDGTCEFSRRDCQEPASLVSNECAGRNTCKFTFPLAQISNCAANFATGLDFRVQCIPEQPTNGVASITCGSNVDRLENGFIVSPRYPDYALAQNCEVKITPPEGKGYKFYLVDIALSPGCYQDVVLLDDDFLCENEKPKLMFESSKPSVLRYKSLTTVNASDITAEALRGFKIYFEAYTPGNHFPNRTTRAPPSFTRLVGQGKSDALYVSAGVIGGVLVVIALLLGFIAFRRNGAGNMSIKFSSKDNTIDNLNSVNNPTMENPLYDRENLDR